MDYTSRPRTNQQPDASNFNFLKHLYGEVGVTNSPVSATSPPDQEQGPPTSEWTNSSPPPNEENEEINEDGENEEDGNERFLRGYGTNAATKDIPEAVMTVYRSILVTGENPLPSNYSHRLLKSDESSEGVLINLGYENYGLLVYKLRPIDPTNDDEE